MIRLWPDDTALMAFLSHEVGLFGDQPRPTLKDRGQRTECGCILSKDIGHYSTCPHLCLYCYANSTQSEVVANHRRHSPQSASIC